MKKINKYSVEFYKSGKYEVEIIDFVNKWGEKEMDAYIRRPDCGLTLFMVGLLYEQTSALDGKTSYTREELLEIVEANLPEHKRFYEDEVRRLEWAHMNYEED